MENKPALVLFRNVGQVYFPQSRVECHYSLTSEHHWSSSDWIGLFQVGWTSLKDYHTYMWATAPEGNMIDYTEGTEVNGCALFTAFYLPVPSEAEYQFVYVADSGEVCGQSVSFTFSAPKPLEELETLKEEQDGEEMLLVVSRAQMLQSQLEECQQLLADVKQALELEKKGVDGEKENSRKAKSVWEHEREAMEEVISELRENLRLSLEKLRKMEGRDQDVQYTHENLSSELSCLWAEKEGNQQTIKELKDEIKIHNYRHTDTDTQLERMKEREKKLSSQLKHEEEKRKSLQVESEAEIRELRQRLASGEHVCESLRRELCEAGLQRDHTHNELHQARLHKAQLTLQMSNENLALVEGRAAWAQEREAFRQAAEIDQNKLQQLSGELQQKEEWLQEERVEREKLDVELTRERDDYRQVQLNYARQELQELKARMRSLQKENQDLIHQLEQKAESEETKSDEEPPYFDSVEEEKEEEVKEEEVKEEEVKEEEVKEEEKTSPVIVLTCSSHRELEKPLEFLSDTKGEFTYDDMQEEWRCTESKSLILPQRTEPLLSDNDIYMW